MHVFKLFILNFQVFKSSKNQPKSIHSQVITFTLAQKRFLQNKNCDIKEDGAFIHGGELTSRRMPAYSVQVESTVVEHEFML